MWQPLPTEVTIGLDWGTGKSQTVQDTMVRFYQAYPQAKAYIEHLHPTPAPSLPWDGKPLGE